MSYAKDITIEDDGSFAVTLRKVSGAGDKITWMILLEKSDGNIEFLSVPSSDGSESLVNPPLAASTGDLDLGEITSNYAENEGESEKSLNDIKEALSLNINDLTAIAKLDDTLKSVLND